MIAKESSFDEMTKDSLSKTIVKNSLAFQREKMVIDPFSLNIDANEVSTENGYLLELIAQGFYGFRKGSSDTIYFINCKDIKII